MRDLQRPGFADPRVALLPPDMHEVKVQAPKFATQVVSGVEAR